MGPSVPGLTGGVGGAEFGLTWEEPEQLMEGISQAGQALLSALSSQGCPAHLQPISEAPVFTQLCRKALCGRTTQEIKTKLGSALLPG